MLRTTTEQDRLHLTTDLRAIDGVPLKVRPKSAAQRLSSDLKRFPPVDDIAAVLDRIAKRAFVA
jgi:hypothetical protein